MEIPVAEADEVHVPPNPRQGQGNEAEDNEDDDEDGQGAATGQIRLNRLRVGPGTTRRENALDAPLIHVPAVCDHARCHCVHTAWTSLVGFKTVILQRTAHHVAAVMHRRWHRLCADEPWNVGFMRLIATGGCV